VQTKHIIMKKLIAIIPVVIPAVIAAVRSAGITVHITANPPASGKSALAAIAKTDPDKPNHPSPAFTAFSDLLQQGTTPVPETTNGADKASRALWLGPAEGLKHPARLELLISVHRNTDHYDHHAHLSALTTQGLIERKESERRYILTALGESHVRRLLNLPIQQP
jgi:hypothetical protein